MLRVPPSRSLSLASRVDTGMLSGTSSLVVPASATATGGSFTATTAMVAVAVLLALVPSVTETVTVRSTVLGASLLLEKVMARMAV